MGMTTDDMVSQLRRRKIPYDNELNACIDYAIACIKKCDSLEEVRKYRKLQAEYEACLKAGWISVNERLPKNKRPVLVSLKYVTGRRAVHMGSIVCPEGIPYWHILGQPTPGFYRVEAWMPLLLEPYEPQESEDKEWKD